jgi:predicted membrane channel-forming protein YqfA (hemolysin III family)
MAFAIAYILIAVMGILPFTNTTFGLMPIFGNNVWFNALTAIAAGYYGLIIPNKIAGTSASHNV